MVTVGDIYNYIDTFAPFHTAMGFDNVGLLVGGKHCPVTSVMVSMDITPEVISEAVSQKAELIISHHPVISSAVKTTVSNRCAVFIGSKRLMCHCGAYQL